MPDCEAVLRGLKDFQRDTVEYVFQRLYTDRDGTRRFLVADEVGLGKTLVARGVIARAVQHLWSRAGQINIVYVCSNAEIARQNVKRLGFMDDRECTIASRVTLLPSVLASMRGRKLNFVSFTPGTSFDLKRSGGWAPERVLLHRLLRRVWGLRGTGSLNLMQGRVANADQFRAWVRSSEQGEPMDENIVRAFSKSLERRCVSDRLAGKPDIRTRFDELCGQFAYKRKLSSIPPKMKKAQTELIGELRHLLAQTCIRLLAPDIIILDEFQRFKSLLDGTDDASELAREMLDFQGPDGPARTLLLSATPYRMYTLSAESQSTEDDHYADFIRTVSFLQDDPQATERLRLLLGSYRQALFDLPDAGLTQLRTITRAIGTELRSVMVRSERLAASDDRSGMLSDMAHDDELQLRALDLRSYVSLQKFARASKHHDITEYWKAAPFLLNFMKGYKLKQAFTTAVDKGDVTVNPLVAQGDTVISRRAVAGRVAADPPHAATRWLLNDTLGRGCHEALWIPPALPYYRLEGPFARLESAGGTTKRLVFSAWRVVPRALAALLSHETERRIFADALRSDRTLDRARKRTAQLLKFAVSEGRPTGMPVLGLLYPSVALAQLGDPLELLTETGGQTVSLADALAAARKRIEPVLQPVVESYSRHRGQVDERWFWAAPALLDLQILPATRSWIESMPSPGKDHLDGNEHTRWDDHVELFQRVVRGEEKLGRAPDELVDVLARIAVAGLGVCALRAVCRISGGLAQATNPENRTAALRIAWALRNLFNLKEATALLATHDPDSPYWRRVLDYAAQGGLQAVLDEYVHLLPEALGWVGDDASGAAAAVAEEIGKAANVRTAQVAIDTFGIRPDGSVVAGEERLRAHFAARFGETDDEVGDSDTGALDPRTRATQLRSAFNSPFWPFVLITTTIGQEGLDFHYYCHAVVHWNLPSNPVDLEQREGRVHRYKGHAVRRNIAASFGRAAGLRAASDPWSWMFDQARATRPANASDIIPYWVFSTPGGARIERHVPALPLSRDLERHGALRRTLALYRMVFGQPRQDELLEYLLDRLPSDVAERYLQELRIDLSPPPLSPADFRVGHDPRTAPGNRRVRAEDGVAPR